MLGKNKKAQPKRESEKYPAMRINIDYVELIEVLPIEVSTYSYGDDERSGRRNIKITDRNGKTVLIELYASNHKDLQIKADAIKVDGGVSL